MMRSLSTSALGQPSETKLTEGAADFVMFLSLTGLSYRRSSARSSCPAFGVPLKHLQHCGNHHFSCTLGPLVEESMRLVLTAAVSGLVLLAQPAFSQTYPTKPIHILVPYAPGGI